MIDAVVFELEYVRGGGDLQKSIATGAIVKPAKLFPMVSTAADLQPRVNLTKREVCRKIVTCL